MDTPLRPRLKVIGVGNAWRGDDAAGLIVARGLMGLMAEPLTQVKIVESSGTAGEVLEALKNTDGAIVVDAVSSGGPPGAIYRFDAYGAGVPAELSRSPSSHGWGVAEALALGQVLGELPPYLIIYGIEGQNFDPGQVLSPEVAAAILEAVQRINGEIQEWLTGGGLVRGSKTFLRENQGKSP